MTSSLDKVIQSNSFLIILIFIGLAIGYYMLRLKQLKSHNKEQNIDSL